MGITTAEMLDKAGPIVARRGVRKTAAFRQSSYGSDGGGNGERGEEKRLLFDLPHE